MIYAFASPEVLERIPICSFVAHTFTDGGAMMPLERMMAIAEDNRKHTPLGFNYASNLFTEEIPEGGVPASQLDVYVALLNQSGWTYDPAMGAWQRFVDTSEKATAGQLHAEIDRLTGRQLKFENIIVVYADPMYSHPLIWISTLNWAAADLRRCSAMAGNMISAGA